MLCRRWQYAVWIVNDTGVTALDSDNLAKFCQRRSVTDRLFEAFTRIRKIRFCFGKQQHLGPQRVGYFHQICRTFAAQAGD